MINYAPRALESYVHQADSLFPVLLVTGARQVGKTTLLKHLSTPERTYVTLDDALLCNLAKEDPNMFLQRFQPPVLIDEIQYAPELLPQIKIRADSDKKPGQFWLTGSQQFHLMKGISESLAGRVGVINLMGFSYTEKLGESHESKPFLPNEEFIGKRLENRPPLGLMALYTDIWRGAFPSMALNEAMDRELFFRSYLQTYLQRDIKDLANVGDERAFLRFTRAAAARTAQLLNLSDLARDADVAVNTAKHWLSILEASGVVYLLEPFHSNLTKRLVKSPKLYFLDTGLCAYLTQWSSPQTLEAGAMSGAIFETWVLAEIVKSYCHNGQRPPLYFYRDKDKKEIDLLIFRDGTLFPIEIKKTTSPNKDALKHFQALKKLKIPIGPGAVICLLETALPLTKVTNSIPVGFL